MLNFLKYKPLSDTSDFELTFSKSENKIDTKPIREYSVSEDINENIYIIKKLMHMEINEDIILRKFNWSINSHIVSGIIVFADGIVNGSSINQFVLMPLMSNNYYNPGSQKISQFFVESVLPQNQISYEQNLSKITDSVNFGNAGIILDGCNEGIIIDIKSWEHRDIGTPINETVVQGPHEAFNEVLRCNTALIRTTINNSNLIFESQTFGNKSKTKGSLAYIEGVVNKRLLCEIKKSFNKVTGDYVFSIFDIEKCLEERNSITLPQIITTERPDKVCRALVEGRVALILNGSSHVLILPSNITDIIASPEDAYLRKPYSVFIKLIRILAVFLSLLTPGLYIAITRFHNEAILTDMMLSLVSARSGVPFSVLTEIIIMEISFELIKEASIRIPGSIGSSLGIVGGLILGQAAVSAGLVSPIIIILVSICGIASFAIPSYSLSFSFRISRFVYIFAGGLFGILGVCCALVIQMTLMFGTESYGVPFFVPFSPKTSNNPILKALFMDNKKIPNPSYLKSYRTGENDDNKDRY